MMENLKLWWSFIKHATKIDGEESNSFRMYYVQHCKELSTSLELPKQNFGPASMCSYCGSLWCANKFQIKIIPGKSFSKSVKRIIKACTMHNQISKFQASLMKKSIKNQMNKIVIKCLVCLKSTSICCNKPKRLKPYKKTIIETSFSISRKKKKKRKKDKTAGLNLSNIKSPNVNENKEILPVHSTPIRINIKRKLKRKEISSVKKIRKTNLKQLNHMLNKSQENKSKNNLSNFLQELY